TALRRRFDAAVEIGVAAFLAYEDRDDDEIATILENGGTAPWLARRLVTFLPVAFGRILLRGATLSNELVTGDRTSALTDDPVYLACTKRAARADREELRGIGLRSAETNALQAAHDTGVETALEDLTFSPVTL